MANIPPIGFTILYAVSVYKNRRSLFIHFFTCKCACPAGGKINPYTSSFFPLSKDAYLYRSYGPSILYHRVGAYLCIHGSIGFNIFFQKNSFLVLVIFRIIFYLAHFYRYVFGYAPVYPCVIPDVYFSLYLARQTASLRQIFILRFLCYFFGLFNHLFHPGVLRRLMLN